MTRVVAGHAKGRRLQVPSAGTRPTSDRAREALFSRLEAWQAVKHARVLDLFGGSGALALEALSRGAQSAVVVDSSPHAVRVVKNNVRVTGFQSQTTVVTSPAQRFVRKDQGTYDLLFLDPPYDMDEESLAEILRLLAPRVSAEATLVIERPTAAPAPTLPTTLFTLSSRKQGAGRIWFVGHRDSKEAPAQGGDAQTGGA